MLPDSRPLPRRLADPAYLDRLRQRAIARMRLEELDAAQVTRRWSLQRIGLVLAAGGLMRSALAARGRTPAPQYGVPGLPGNPPAPAPTSFATRDDLTSLGAWNTSYSVIVANGKSMWNNDNKSKTAYYRMASGQLAIISFITLAGTTYFMPGGKAFYVLFGSDLLGGTLTSTELTLTPSFLKLAATPGGDAAAIQRFASQVDDNAIAAANSRQIHIPTTQDTAPDKLDRYPYITEITLAGGILQITCMSKTGTLYFDLSDKKLVRSAPR